MESHRDRDFVDPAWLASLEAKANKMRDAGESQITGGKPGEEELGSWSVGGVTIRQLPVDEHGILRISIGGGDVPSPGMDYCVFRGDRAQCRRLLSKVVRALAAIE